MEFEQDRRILRYHLLGKIVEIPPGNYPKSIVNVLFMRNISDETNCAIIHMLANVSFHLLMDTDRSYIPMFSRQQHLIN
jgi:hypothetical protein